MSADQERGKDEPLQQMHKSTSATSTRSEASAFSALTFPGVADNGATDQEAGASVDTASFEKIPYEQGRFVAYISKTSGRFKKSLTRHERIVSLAVKSALFLLYNAYLCWATYLGLSTNDGGIDWCDGVGLLIIITFLAYVTILWKYVLRDNYISFRESHLGLSIEKFVNEFILTQRASVLLYAVVFAGLAIFLYIDTASNRDRLISALGIVLIIAFGFTISRTPHRIQWRLVLWGLGLQFAFGLAVLRSELGRAIFTCLGDKIKHFLRYTDKGSAFVFGFLVSQQPFDARKLENGTLAYEVASDINAASALKFTVFFKALSAIYFFSFIVSMLYYLGIIQRLVIEMGRILQITIGTTAAESMSVAANVFLGNAEAPLLVRPYLASMTRSELHAVLTGGYATVAGAIMAAYVSFGISASHLLSASLMSAPAALAMSKLLYPETRRSRTKSEDIKIDKGNEANILDAATQGALTAVFLVANITASLIAIIAFVAFLNGILQWFGSLVHIQGLTFEWLLGKMFIPLAWVMGIQNEDLEHIGQVLGLNTFVNALNAYSLLGELSAASLISERSKVIATYALCGFTHPAAIGIQIASLGTMAPSRKGDIARLALRAFISGSMACFLTACVAGTLIT